jgi:ferrous iron transport protein B
MDRVMKSLGLHGRAFVPMLSGFACAVPAILATRTMERQRDRLLTMLVIPLMTCSARLPVYSLIVATLFPVGQKLGFIPVQSGLLVFMYVFSMVTTLVAAGILGRTVVRGRHMPLLLELPPYRLPSLSGTLKLMWERSTLFLREAGTVILACTVVLWALLSYPKATPEPPATAVAAEHAPSTPSAQNANSAAHQAASSPIEESFGGQLGKAIEPLIRPLGFDWKLGVGIIGAFAAREVFVSTLGLVYGLGDLDDEAKPLRERMRAERSPTGGPVYTPLVGLSLMVFFALSCQCMSTLAVVRRETRTLRWPLFMFAYMTGLAYVASLVVYQGGRLLGF